jgi:biopolymer transport protein ExbB
MEWLKMTIDYGIIGGLAFLSVVSLSIAIERYLVLRRIRIEDYREKKALELELTKKIHLIATIGSNAPYIGLLGTVFGIMLTFYSMGQSGFMDTNNIMIGLALALKATAVGLVVAIPSITCYNLLMRQVKVLIMQWELQRERAGI